MIVLLIMVFVILGCKNNSLLNYRRVKPDYLNGKIKKAVQNIGDKNGVYVCKDGKKTMYLLIKGKHETRGAENLQFSNVVIEPKGNVLNISFNENYTKESTNRKLENNIMYRIKLHRNFDLIKVFKNGKETQFDDIYL